MQARAETRAEDRRSPSRDDIGAIDAGLRTLAAIIDARGERGLVFAPLIDRLEAERETAAAESNRLDDIRRKYLKGRA